MTAQTRLDRKARTAVAAAVALLLAGPLFLVVKHAISKVDSGSEAQVFHPQDDELVLLPDGSTLLVKHKSTGRRIAEWLKLDRKGAETFEVGNANFTPGSAELTPGGWQHLSEFARMLKAHHNVRAVILFSAYHGHPETVQLEHDRADVIHDEAVKQGVDEEQINVAPEAFQAGHNAAKDEGLDVVLTNRG